MSPEKKRITESKVKLEFLANTKHKLYTPLNSVIGFSQLLKQKVAGELNEKQEHYVDNILINSKQLLDIITDVFDMLRIETENMELITEQFSVPDVIDETLTLIKEKAAKRNVILKKELDPALDMIEADRSKFSQILLNLLDNAVKFSKDDGGTVTITTKKLDDIAQFSVLDTGIGMSEKDIGKLFKTYEKPEPGTSGKYEGTGLGLVISKYLVEMHGGKIAVDSKLGEGSTFTVLLLLKQERGIK